MHFEHSSSLLFYKANSKETIPRRESVVKNNELGEDWGSVLPPKAGISTNARRTDATYGLA